MATWDQVPLDPDEADRLRREGEEATKRKRKEEYDYVVGVIKRLVVRYRRITADHVRKVAEVEGRVIEHGSVVGAAFSQLSREGEIACVDHIKSRAVARQGGTDKVWSLASRVHKGE